MGVVLTYVVTVTHVREDPGKFTVKVDVEGIIAEIAQTLSIVLSVT